MQQAFNLSDMIPFYWWEFLAWLKSIDKGQWLSEIKAWVFLETHMENNICIVLIRIIITFGNQIISVINVSVVSINMIKVSKNMSLWIIA